jgi:glyoxylase-like metal-dependent hydrolase (beta-lactamase superfamily II)
MRAGLEIVALPNGQFVENCYLVADAASREAVIVDPGEEPQMFLAELDTRGWTPKAIWLTHGHVDHVLGVARLHREHGLPIYLHPADRGLYDGVPRQAEWMGLRAEPLPAPTHELAHGDVVQVGRFRFDVRHVPGHSPGSVAFVGDGVVISGDALFSGSIGRTDLPGGDFGTLLQSIQSQLLALPDSTQVLSGHGPATTIGVERLTNPFLAGVPRGD